MPHLPGFPRKRVHHTERKPAVNRARFLPGAKRDPRAKSRIGLNSEVEAPFGVSMGTIRKRAAQIERLLAV